MSDVRVARDGEAAGGGAPAEFPCLLARAAHRFPNALALLTAEGSTWSFHQLDAAVSERALALRAQGLREGAWVALRIRTTAAGVIDWLALLRAGAYALPLSERLPDRALRELLDEHGLEGQIPQPGAALQRSDWEQAAPPVSRKRRSGVDESALCWHFRADRPCAGVLTSGSTGRPRIAVHSYANHVRSAEGAAQQMPLQPESRYLLSLPLNHVGGLAILFRTLAAGATMVLGGRAEDADFLRRYAIHYVSLVETQLRRLLAAAEPLPQLQRVLLGGGPVAESLLAAAAERGLACWLSYGLTEMASQVVTHDPAGRGAVLPYRELHIADDGEIWVRGETLFLGYLEAGRVQAATDAAGWFQTRDLGRWQGQRLEIIGRKDNQFISGGENIQPEQIESELTRHPQIDAAVIVPRPDPEFGFRPVAFLAAAGAMPAAEELQAWLRERLASYQLPVAYRPLPEYGGLKPQRRDLERIAAAEDDD
ncbi:o-succinylbenzoate--CoA ligase [Halorhodospira abdelmalekii]|nr:o-succinylbenzoate--CoA ligase [Halorhodospira abdelmalekii]